MSPINWYTVWGLSHHSVITFTQSQQFSQALQDPVKPISLKQVHCWIKGVNRVRELVSSRPSNVPSFICL